MGGGGRSEAARSIVRKLVQELSPHGLDPLQPEHLLQDDLGFDSIGLMEVAVAIEDELDIELLQSPSARNLRTYADLENMVVSAINGCTER